MAAEFDLEQTDRLLTTTRAVRKRLDLTRPVEREVVLECLRVATQAPSGGNRQRGRWLVVRDAAKKKAIADLYARSYEDYITPQLAVLDPEDRASVRMVESSRYLADHMADVPLLVVPCILDRLPPDAGPAEVSGFYGGILPAVWSFQLALRSRGLGSAWTTLHLEYERQVGELLDIPLTVTQVALLPVAYYRGEGFRQAPRRPVEEITYVDRWKAPWE